MTKAEKKEEAEFAFRILRARQSIEYQCQCWEGCNDREGKLPCIHDMLWEGLKLWIKKYPTAKSARYH